MDFHPLTADRWADLEALFEPNGPVEGCWCMYWRVTAGGWKTGSGRERKGEFRARVEAGPPPGILAYEDGRAIGWAQVTPRSDVPRYNRTRTGRPAPGETDLDRVFALSCFFVHRDHRGTGLMKDLARAACSFAAGQGATAVEAAPLDPRRPLIWGEGYVGIASSLRAAGFEDVERRTPIRPFMRWTP